MYGGKKKKNRPGATYKLQTWRWLNQNRNKVAQVVSVTTPKWHTFAEQ